MGSIQGHVIKNGTSGYLAWRSQPIRLALASLLTKKIKKKTSMMGVQ